MDDDQTRLLRGLLAAVDGLCALPHSGQVRRVLLAVAAARGGCSDGEVAFNASLPVAAVRGGIAAMLDRCRHVPALLTAKTNRHPLGTTYTGIRLIGDAARRRRKIRDYLTRTDVRVDAGDLHPWPWPQPFPDDAPL